MALDFPANPAVDDIYEGFQWDGNSWVPIGGGTGEFLPLTGGTINGNVRFQTGDLQLRNTGGYNSSSVVIEGLADSGNKLCDIRVGMGGEAGAGVWEFWTENGVNWSTTWAFKTTVASPPGIDVQGTASVATLADRSLLADPEFAQFACGEGESRGVDLGRVVKHLLAEIKALKAAR